MDNLNILHYRSAEIIDICGLWITHPGLREQSDGLDSIAMHRLGLDCQKRIEEERIRVPYYRSEMTVTEMACVRNFLICIRWAI